MFKYNKIFGSLHNSVNSPDLESRPCNSGDFSGTDLQLWQNFGYFSQLRLTSSSKPRPNSSNNSDDLRRSSGGLAQQQCRRPPYNRFGSSKIMNQLLLLSEHLQ
ncbi:hypothetical protein LIER_25721 [Lithospermum erythrorhizon]|uniref:Uncharacterized protein n=1 Tax=Lithospermum erythrorhizon TaxID=34254 RepID=A0AAV3R7V9_LITER